MLQIYKWQWIDNLLRGRAWPFAEGKSEGREVRGAPGLRNFLGIFLALGSLSARGHSHLSCGILCFMIDTRDIALVNTKEDCFFLRTLREKKSRRLPNPPTRTRLAALMFVESMSIFAVVINSARASTEIG